MGRRLVIVALAGALVPVPAAAQAGPLGRSRTRRSGTAARSGRWTPRGRRWAATGLRDYRFTVSRGCFCPEDYTRPRRITVRDGKARKPLTIDRSFMIADEEVYYRAGKLRARG